MQDLISRVPLFASLPKSEIEYLARTLRPRQFAAGSLLFHEGTVGDVFHILLSGQVEIIKALGTRDEQLLRVGEPGSFIGEMSLFSREGRRTASVRARTPVTTLEMTHAEFDALLQRHPSLAYDMVRVMSRRLEESQNLALRDLQAKNRQLTTAYRRAASRPGADHPEGETGARAPGGRQDSDEHLAPPVARSGGL